MERLTQEQQSAIIEWLKIAVTDINYIVGKNNATIVDFFKQSFPTNHRIVDYIPKIGEKIGSNVEYHKDVDWVTIDHDNIVTEIGFRFKEPCCGACKEGHKCESDASR